MGAPTWPLLVKRRGGRPPSASPRPNAPSQARLGRRTACGFALPRGPAEPWRSSFTGTSGLSRGRAAPADNASLSAMLRSQHRSAGIVVGVDAGGTWVRVRALADARPVASVAHPARAVPELATFLHNLWRRRGWTRARVDALVVASRGVWLPRERRALRRRLSGLARRVNVIADVEAAWHATLGAERGVLVVAGTGSIALGPGALRLPPPVVVGGAGSVMGDRWFAAGVRSALARAGVRAHWRESGGAPVDAAARLAAALAAGGR